MAAAGAAAGIVTGLFGGGGGMVLVPLLALLTDLEEAEIFPGSIAVILPICIVSLILSPADSWRSSLPFLPGTTALPGRISAFSPPLFTKAECRPLL